MGIAEITFTVIGMLLSNTVIGGVIASSISGSVTTAVLCGKAAVVAGSAIFYNYPSETTDDLIHIISEIPY